MCGVVCSGVLWCAVVWCGVMWREVASGKAWRDAQETQPIDYQKRRFEYLKGVSDEFPSTLAILHFHPVALFGLLTSQPATG